MSVNVSFAGGNCQLRADRKLCVRLNLRDEREVSAKGCKPHARERTAVTSSARSQRWRRSGEGRRRVHDGGPKKNVRADGWRTGMSKHFVARAEILANWCPNVDGRRFGCP